MPPPNLMTVEQMIKGVRNLLLDKIRPYRYSDISLIAALNITLNDARRLRPDLFIDRYGIEVPQYEEVSGAVIPIEAQFRLPIEYGIAGHALLRDEEDIQDSRANTFILNYLNMLTGQRPHIPVEGGTPVAKSKARGGAPQPGSEG
jgi:hypothetical protein